MIQERIEQLKELSEVEWDEALLLDPPVRLTAIQWDRSEDNRPVPGGEFHGIESLVWQYQQPYDDEMRRGWIEKRLRAWWKGQQG